MILQITYYMFSVFGILKKRSKILTLLMVAVMWVVFGLCTYNGDFGNYYWIYRNIQNPAYWSEFEPLFTALMYLCSIVGLTFIQFRMVFGAIYLALLYITIKKYTENVAEVLGLYMLFPFLTFTSIIRAGFAGVLIVLAYYEIFNDKPNKIRFWLLIMVAFLIHRTTLVFILYYFFCNSKYKKTVGIAAIAIVLLGLLSYYSGLLYRAASLITKNYRTLKWLVVGSSSQQGRWILYLIIIDLLIIFMAYISKYDGDKIQKNQIDSSSKNCYATNIYLLSLSMLIIIPTFFISNASARLLWEILLFVFISFGKNDEIKHCGLSKSKIVISKQSIIVIIILLFFSFYVNMPYKNTINDANLTFYNNLIYGTGYPN